MRTPTSLLNRPGRAAAVVGAVLAVSAGATVAFVASASADEPGRCIQNVNVREKPDVNSRIVALCEAGTAVQVAETRDGFVHLTNLNGWAAQQYVSVNGRSPAPAATERSGSRTAPGNENGRTPDESQPRRSGSNAGDRDRSGSSNGDSGSTGDSDNDSGSTDDSGSTGNDDNESGHSDDHGGGVGGLLG